MQQYKTCPHCRQSFPATPEYFNRDKNTKDGLVYRCKPCERARFKQYYNVDPDHHRKRALDYRNAHLEESRAKDRRWYYANPDKVKAKQKRYKQDPVKNRARVKAWVKANPVKRAIQTQKRNTAKRGLPRTFTDIDWLYALEYWHGVCAYCGNPPRLWDVPRVLHQDHFIPVSPAYQLTVPNPGYVKTNVLPACQDCNTHKHNSDPHDWLLSRYSAREVTAIEARIAAYFDSVTE